MLWFWSTEMYHPCQDPAPRLPCILIQLEVVPHRPAQIWSLSSRKLLLPQLWRKPRSQARRGRWTLFTPLEDQLKLVLWAMEQPTITLMEHQIRLEFSFFLAKCIIHMQALFLDYRLTCRRYMQFSLLSTYYKLLTIKLKHLL